MTLAHHDTSHCDERSCGETPLLCTEQTGDGDVPASPQLPISLDNNPPAKVIEDEGLMRFGKTKLPWETCVLDASPS